MFPLSCAGCHHLSCRVNITFGIFVALLKGDPEVSRENHLGKSLGLVCQPFALQLIYCSHSVTGLEAFFSKLVFLEMFFP